MSIKEQDQGYGSEPEPEPEPEPQPQPQPKTLVRRDIWELEQEQAWHPITRAFAEAVRVMQSRPEANPTSWAYQAAVHGTEVNPDEFRNQCQHNSWFFVSWHRMYLYWFEQIIRSIVQTLDSVDQQTKDTWALPFWNYDRGAPTNSLPPAFRDRQTPDGQSNPLFVRQRDPRINAGGGMPDGPTGVTNATAALAEEQYSGPADAGILAGFGGPQTGWHHFDESGFSTPGALEQQPHNLVHGQVGGRGGFMSGFDTAPLDPVFWLHHCNVDRLWEVWIRQPNRQNPTQAAWTTDEVFKFHNAQEGEESQTSSNVVDTAKDLGYTYAGLTPLGQPEGGFAVSGPAEPMPSRPAELVGATDEPLQLTGDPVATQLSLSAPSSAFAAEAAEPSRVYLNVEGIQGDENPGTSYAVYVNIPDDDPATDDSHHVGHVAFFGIEKASSPDSEHQGGLRYVFDITDLYRRLKGRGAWDDNAVVRVTFKPVRVEMPPDADASFAAEEQAEP